MSDVIKITGLRVDTVIGVYDWERNIKQQLRFDILMHTSIASAGRSDDVADTVDYAEVSQAVIDLATSRADKLIETLAEETARLILRDFPVEKVEIELSKPGAVEAADNISLYIARPRPV